MAGLDLSLTSTGIANAYGNDVSVCRVKPRDTGHGRLDELLAAVELWTYGADLVVVEGPAFGAKGSAYHQLAGLWWLVAHHLHTGGRPYVVVPPSDLKTYATGKGNAGKDDVLAAVVRRYDPVVQVAGNDQADALVLAAMGRRHLGAPIEPTEPPATHLRAMAKIAWPALPATAYRVQPHRPAEDTA